ncbi:CoA transferase [Mycolicibacterium moriokaense]|nr:CoA transferase [Mycolicibacterium moriokaense]
MSGPLAGIVVVDFTERVQGPYATQMLGDFGADVIKIERPTAVTPDGRPDERYADGTGAPPDSLYRATFLANNRSKRSIAVDLKSEEGLRTMRALVGTADIVYENFRPGVMDRLGLGYDACREINPGIVYISASGYGPDGPRVNKPGQDVLIQAMSGIGVINEAADGRPTPIGMSITDVLGGLNGVAAVLAALVHRERTGEGQQVWVDLLGSAFAALSEHLVHMLNNRADEPSRVTPMHGHGYIPPPYGFYATKDGFLALSSGRQVREICEIVGLADLSVDPRFDTYAKRAANQGEFEAMIEEALKARTTDEWLAVMEPADIFAARVNTLRDAVDDPQAVATGRVVSVDSPDGPLRLVAPAARFGRTPLDVRQAPPRHGEHTEQIRRELGLDRGDRADTAGGRR